MGGQIPCKNKKGHATIPIQKNLLTLLLTGQTQDCLRIMNENPNIQYAYPINMFEDNFLHYACKKNNYEVVRYILSHCPQAADKANKNNKYPIDFATSNEVINLMPMKKKNQNSQHMNLFKLFKT